MKNNRNLITGLHPVIEGIKSGKQIDTIFIQENLKGELVFELKKLAREGRIPFKLVPTEKLDRMAPGKHQGVAAYLSGIEYFDIADILPTIYEKGEVPFLVLLDRITDVRNFGAIARTAYAAGVHAMIIPAQGSAQINEDTFRSSAGALHHMTLCRDHNLKEVLDYLHGSGVKIVACTEDAEKNYFEVDFSVPTVLLLGSEENGISNEYLKYAQEWAKISMPGNIGSLNVSVAAGIIMFEAVKQKTAMSKV